MPRQDGRIEQGQSLRSAISARAWNRAQDAADIVLSQRYGINADGIDTARLPGVRVKLVSQGWFGQAARVVSGESAQPPNVDVTPYSANEFETLQNFSEDEKQLVSFTLPAANTTDVSGDLSYGRIVICCGNASRLWTIAGYAITRVRLFNYNHRYARFPKPILGQTSEQSAEVRGCLDSAFYGPVQVVGYWSDSGSFSHYTETPGIVYPNYQMRWALVML